MDALLSISNCVVNYRAWMDNELAKRLDAVLGRHGETLTISALRNASTMQVRACVVVCGWKERQ